ncbi:MAG: hypothetical protein CM15mP74_24610 [Halieaceae bacterium]|nr:MAG: hypothetical protein CM15mP74_24610 [Halieaceae bacterium]
MPKSLMPAGTPWIVVLVASTALCQGQTFTYDLFELGEFYLEYCELMDHWNAVLPGAVLHVQYERLLLTSTPGPQDSRLLRSAF